MDNLEELSGILYLMYGIEIVEFEDSNHLAGDNKSRSRTRQAILRDAFDLIDKMRIERSRKSV